jgi:hypothetical protein
MLGSNPQDSARSHLAGSDVSDVLSVILTGDTHLVPGEYESLQVGPAFYQRAHFLNLVAAQVQPLQVRQAQDSLGYLKQVE